MLAQEFEPRRTFSSEMMLRARPTAEPIYEDAEDEGNYALPGILAVARRLEQ